MIYLVEILKEAWNATSFYFFLNPSFVVVPCHQPDIILFPRIRSLSGDQFQSIVAGASTSERWYDYHWNVQKIACRSKFEKLGLFFVLSKCDVLGWVWVWVGFFFWVLFWQLFFGSSAQMAKIVANYYSNMVLQHVKGHHLEFHLRLSVLAYLTGTPFLISFCNGSLPSDR